MLCAKSCLTFAIPQTTDHQALLSIRLSRQEYWSGLPFPSPRKTERRSVVAHRWEVEWGGGGDGASVRWR